MDGLFANRFSGFPLKAFEIFDIPSDEARRKAIFEQFHPGLQQIGESCKNELEALSQREFHLFLPRLNWPKGYRPFCTWMALSTKSSGYQTGPQLNLGIHRDYVAARLGWDTTQADFGRFELLVRYGKRAEALKNAAETMNFKYRVFAAAPWPQGSKETLVTSDDLKATFAEVQRRGVWWECGRQWKLHEHSDLITSEALLTETCKVFSALLPAII